MPSAVQLRLTVLAAVGLLTLVIYLINVNPLLVVVSWLARANCVAGEQLIGRPTGGAGRWRRDEAGCPGGAGG